MAKRATKRRDVVSSFRDTLWELFEERASGMDGAEVVSALKQAGEEIWAVGIDDTNPRLLSIQARYHDFGPILSDCGQAPWHL